MAPRIRRPAGSWASIPAPEGAGDNGRTITSSSGRRLHYPAVINTRTREISPRYLSEEERVHIADLRRQGLTVRAIAAALDRSLATISRELRRNRDPASGQYRDVDNRVKPVALRERPAQPVRQLLRHRGFPNTGNTHDHDRCG